LNFLYQPFFYPSRRRNNGRWVWDASFSADSAYLVTASSDFTARLWDVASGEVIRHYKSPMAITCVALNDASG
jgi:G protein beta subunit-like protein